MESSQVGRRRSVRLLAVSLFAFLATAAIPAVALSLPNDPPIEPLAPADGTSLLAAETASVHVTFKCPSYHLQGDQLGGDTNYRVRFSSSPSLGGDGLISSTLGNALSTLEPDKASCGADFEAPIRVRPLALFQGTVYWQVTREVKRTNCSPCGPKTKKEEDEEEEKIFQEGEEEEAAEEKGVVFEPKGEWEGGPVRSFSLQPKVEGAELTTQRRVFGGYLTAIEFTSASELTGASLELQRFTKGAWQSISQQEVSPTGSTFFFAKLPSGRQALRAIAKSATVSLPLEPRKLTVHKLGKHRLTTSDEDGRYREKPAKKTKKGQNKRLPLSFAVVDGGTRLVHLRAAVEGICAPTSRSGEEVPLTLKIALRSARIAPDGTVIADRQTKGPEPQQVTFVGQLLAGSLIATVTTTYKNCSGSRKFEAIPIRKD